MSANQMRFVDSVSTGKKSKAKVQSFINDQGEVIFATKREIRAFITAIVFGFSLTVERWFVGFQVCVFLYAIVDYGYIIIRYKNRKFEYQNSLLHDDKGTYITCVDEEIAAGYAKASHYYQAYDDVEDLSRDMDDQETVKTTLRSRIKMRLSIIKLNLFSGNNILLIIVLSYLGFCTFVALYYIFLRTYVLDLGIF